MRVRVTVFVLLLFCSALPAALFVMSANEAPGHPRPPEVSVPPEALDFGVVCAQGDFEWTLPLHNETAHEVVVDEIVTSCHCTRVDASSIVLSPGETADCGLLLNLLPGKYPESPGELRQFSVYVTATVHGSRQERRRWGVTGRVQDALSVSASEVQFEQGDPLLSLQPRFAPRTIHIQSAFELASVSADVHPPVAAVSCELESSTDGIIELAPIDGLPVGPLDALLRISATTADGRELPALSIPVTGVVLDDVQLVPSALVFSPNTVGDMCKATVVLTSRTGKDVVVAQVETGSATTLVEPAELPTEGFEGARAYLVRQRIARRGRQSEEVAFVLKRGPGQIRRIPLHINYVGVATP